MPFDGSGNFNRNFPAGGWQGDAAANIRIMADRHDQHDNDLAGGLTNCITKDGQSQPLANIPMNGKRITNMADPVDPDDAATKKFVQTITGWTTSKTIEGADLNGRLIFSGTGVTGIQWTVTDLSWLARPAEASKTRNRLVLNDKADGTGTDVFIIDEGGFANSASGYFTHNTSYTGAWRTISPGISTLMNVSNGAFNLYSNDTGTASAYQTASVRNFVSINNSGGHTAITLPFNGSTKTSAIHGTNNGVQRWLFRLGNGEAESGGNAGSNFDLHRYDDGGGYLGLGLSIARASGAASFSGTVTGANLHSNDGSFQSNVAVAYLTAAAGPIYLRPNGIGSAYGEQYFDTGGNAYIGGSTSGPAAIGGTYLGKGFRGKQSMSGNYSGTYWINFHWTGASFLAYANDSVLGTVAFQCDYRIKKDIKPLASTWDKVKKLNPISYSQKAYEVWTEDDDERWGFMAHELQERLFKGAASGEKDGPEVQSPNLLAIVAGLTKALQEAMTRIEALEAAA